MKPIHAFLLSFAATGFLLVGGPGATVDLLAATSGLAPGPISLPTI